MHLQNLTFNFWKIALLFHYLHAVSQWWLSLAIVSINICLTRYTWYISSWLNNSSKHVFSDSGDDCVLYFLFLCADDIQLHLFKLQLEGHLIVVEQRNTKLSKEKQLKVLLVHSVSWRGTLANFSNMYLLYCDTIISDRLIIIIIYK